VKSIAPTDGPYVIYEGKKFLDFSSCDFLGLAQHPEVKKSAIKYALKYGVGACDHSTPQKEVESKLARYLNKECAFLFACSLELQTQLEKAGATVLSTETNEPSSLKKTKGFKVADDTYLFGLTGTNGFGSAAELSTTDAICGSLLSGSVTFLAGSKKQLASFIPGALSFPIIGALDCALSFIPEMEVERKTIQKYKTWLTKALGKLSAGQLSSPRVFIKTDHADALRQFFLKEEIYLDPSHSKPYFSVTVLHTPDDFDQLSTALKKLAATDLALATQSLTLTP
jgi:hypothetical protein